MVEWLFNLLFYCECGISQYARQKTLIHVSGVNLLLRELSCFKAPEHEYIFLKYSRNLNISGIF